MTARLTVSRASVVCFLFLGVAAVQADDDQLLSQIDKQLARIQSFEYGADGRPATELEQLVFQLPTDSPIRGEIEGKLIDALADANGIARGVICRQLRVIGTDECVPAVAQLLSDTELSSFARYTLEGIGSDAARKAMHQALGSVSGELQVGLLTSLGRLGHQATREDCVRLIGSQNSQVAAAAICALGKLGGSESIQVLTDARSTATEELAKTIDLALLACAEDQLARGDADSAAAVYAKLYDQGGAFRLAGLRGLVAAQPTKAGELLVDAIGGDDAQQAAAAISLTRQATGEQVTKKLVSLLGGLTDGRRVLLIKALGQRGDETAVPAIVAAAGNADSQIRLAAIDALGGLRGEQAIETLLEIAQDSDSAAASVARASLARVKDADAPLAAIARQPDEHRAVEAIRALASRQAKDSTDLMLQLANGENVAKRVAAIEALGTLADSANVTKVVSLLLAPHSEENLPGIEDALGSVLMRVATPTDRAAPLLDVLPNASDSTRPALIRLLARAGNTEALDAVSAALEESDSKASEAAVVSLANWPNSAAADKLIPLLEGAKTPDSRKVALDGFVRIASESEDPNKLFLDALDNVATVDVKKRVLNEIGEVCESFEVIESIQSLYSNPDLAAVAAIATVRIAYKLRRQGKERVREILEDVLAKVEHADVQNRAQEVVNDLDKYDDHILDWVAIGPFVDQKIVSGNISYATAFDPETSAASDLDWKPLTRGIGSWNVNLATNYGDQEFSSAYVKSMIWSPIEQAVQIEGGCDDAMKIWVNGQLLHEGWRTGGNEPRQIRVAAQLNKGWNELKLKLTNHQAGWEFACRVRKPNGTKLEGLKYEAR